MMSSRFVPITEKELAGLGLRSAHGTSEALLSEFLEAGLEVAKLDRTGLPSSLPSLQASLRSLIQSRGFPVKVMVRKGEIYLVKTEQSGIPS